MNNILIIYAHPNHDGHNGIFLEKISQELKNQNMSFDLIDLYAINYDPVLKDSELYSQGKKEVSEQNTEFQNKIKEADKLLFIYPAWWQNMPAILKGFIDRVFVSGFAFVYKLGIPLPLLKGKKAAVVTTGGGPNIYHRLIIGQTPNNILSRHVLNFVGIRTKNFHLGLANKTPDENMISRIEKLKNEVIKYLK